MLFGEDFESLDSDVVQRKGRRIAVSVYRVKSMQFLSLHFQERGRFVNLSFNCFEGLFESRKDDFWAIADSYEYALTPDQAAAVKRGAAEQGDAAAQTTLGFMYQMGRGV